MPSDFDVFYTANGKELDILTRNTRNFAEYAEFGISVLFGEIQRVPRQRTKDHFHCKHSVSTDYTDLTDF